MDAIELIKEERREQIEDHGFTAETDDAYQNWELLYAGIYCMLGVPSEIAVCHTPTAEVEALKFPFSPKWGQRFHDKTDRIDQLTVGIALATAELDRLLRAKEKIE